MQTVQTLLKRRSVKYAVPFLILVVGGSFGLREFTQLRYTFSKRTTSTIKEDMRNKGIEVKPQSEITLEGEYEKVKEMDIDNWEQVRGPRPWEENVDR